MKSFLKSLMLVAIVAFALAQPVKAQLVSANPAGPIVVAANVTTNTAGLDTIVIDCSAQRNVAIKWTFNLNGAGTDTIGIRLFPSLDKTLPSSPTLATGYVLVGAANGTTPVIVNTNFDSLGYRYLVGGFITNASAAQILTNDISYYVKRNAP